MAPLPGHASRWLWLVLATTVLATMGWVVSRPRPLAVERLAAEAASHGWAIAASEQETGAFSSILRKARLSHRQIPGVTAEIDEITVRHWPWLRPKITVSEVRAQLYGDPGGVLRAIASLTGFGVAPTVEGDVNATYHHRAIGSVELDGVTGHRRGPNLIVHAKQARIGKRSWQAVTVALEPQGETVKIAPGEDVGSARVQLSCFPSSGGKSRWLLDLAHQAVRPLASRVGWDLGQDFDETRIAGSLSLDCPDDLSQPAQGRVQLVVDRWPTAAPAEAEPVLGQTMSLLSNLVPASDGSGWELPRVEITTLVFKLVGNGRVDLGDRARLTLAGEGEKTCRQLRALIPPSEQRERVSRYLAERNERAVRAAVDEQARLGLQWNLASGAAARPVWHFQGGCGLDAWPTTTDTAGR